MKHLRIYVCMLLLVSVLVSVCSCSIETMIQPRGRAKLVVIGLDYANSPGAPNLTGTINDAREIAASFRSVFDAKDIPLDIVWLVQEGYDVQMEVDVTSISAFEETLGQVQRKLEDYSPTFMETYILSPYDARIVVKVPSVDVARSLMNYFSEKYPGSPALVTSRYMSLRDMPDYPSKENIEKTLSEMSVTKDDLLIVYYTGHGEIYNVAPKAQLYELLKKHSENGTFGEDLIQEVMTTVDMYTEENVCSVLADAGVGGSGYNAFRSDLNKLILQSQLTDGALITAPTEKDYYYGIFRMKRFYDILSQMDCSVVTITDACYSGFMAQDSYFGNSVGDALRSFMSVPDWPNVASLSASTSAETSKVTVARNEEGTFQRHSMFTIEVLRQLGWAHTDLKHTYMTVPFYSFDDAGKAVSEERVIEVPGYQKTIPGRISASDFFDAIMNEWINSGSQTPQNNTTVKEIYLVP